MKTFKERVRDGVTQHKCPQCQEWYVPDLKEKPERSEDVEPYKSEQYISGICSDECWFKYTHATTQIEEYSDLDEDMYLIIVDFDGDDYDKDHMYRVDEITSGTCHVTKVDRDLNEKENIEWDENEVNDLAKNYFVGFNY